ncbi:MAG TPA: peptidylprolyl isomerase [Thermoanaerobaculia bacterium]|nr:peptidylprolyl isomerase [Thermoanaerobaculia bacterium]
MKRDITVALIAVAAVLAITFGLAQMRPDLPQTPSAPYTPAVSHAASGAAPRMPAKSGKVVMRVNGEPITEAEFMAFLTAVPEQQRAVFAGPAGKRELANELVRMKALEQEAQRLGVEDDPEVAAQMGLLRTQVTAQRALQKIVQQSAEKEVAIAYEREKKNALALRHIVVAYAGGMVPPKNRNQQPPTPEQAMLKAAAIAARVRGGTDFAQLARTESDDVQSAQNGGSLGPMRADTLPPEIAGVVSKLKPGQVSDPVRTQFGIHVFNVAEPSLADLRPMLLQQVQQDIAQREIVRLQKAAQVDLDPQFFPPVPPGAVPPQQPQPNPRGGG